LKKKSPHAVERQVRVSSFEFEGEFRNGAVLLFAFWTLKGRRGPCGHPIADRQPSPTSDEERRTSTQEVEQPRIEQPRDEPRDGAERPNRETNEPSDETGETRARDERGETVSPFQFMQFSS
jgi:hypothetical protein